jgi:hypothetical protein
VFARRERLSDELPVLVRGRGDDHGLHVLVGEHLLVIALLRRAGGVVRRALEHGRVSVADGDDLGLLGAPEDVHNLAPPWPEPDDRDIHRERRLLLRRGLRLRPQLHRTQRGQHGGEGALLHKRAAVEIRLGVRRYGLVHARYDAQGKPEGKCVSQADRPLVV